MTDHLRTGKPEIDPHKPSHIKGVPEGNAVGNYEKSPGHLADGTSNAARSTGINPKAHDPILAVMPKLSPP